MTRASFIIWMTESLEYTNPKLRHQTESSQVPAQSSKLLMRLSQLWVTMKTGPLSHMGTLFKCSCSNVGQTRKRCPWKKLPGENSRMPYSWAFWFLNMFLKDLLQNFWIISLSDRNWENQLRPMTCYIFQQVTGLFLPVWSEFISPLPDGINFSTGWGQRSWIQIQYNQVTMWTWLAA